MKQANSNRTRQAILVAGMHRSGTSALTRVLALLGAELPKKLMPPMQDNNEQGFWESSDLVQIHDRLLASAGSSWDDWSEFNTQWYQSPTATTFATKTISWLEQDFSDSSLFVIKDPRICRFLPFWTQLLENRHIEPTVVIPFRAPLEVAQSLKKRDGITTSYGLLLWLRHVLDACHHAKALPRAFVCYDHLLENWKQSIQQLSRQTGLAWPKNSPDTEVEIDLFLDPDARHHCLQHKDDGDFLEQMASEVFHILLSLEQDPQQDNLQRKLDKIRKSFGKYSKPYALALTGEKKRCARQIEKQKTAQQQALTKIREQHHAALDTLNNKKEQEISRLRADYESRLAQLKTAQEQTAATASRLQDQLHSKQELLEQASKDAITFKAHQEATAKHVQQLSEKLEQSQKQQELLKIELAKKEQHLLQTTISNEQVMEQLHGAIQDLFNTVAEHFGALKDFSFSPGSDDRSDSILLSEIKNTVISGIRHAQKIMAAHTTNIQAMQQSLDNCIEQGDIKQQAVEELRKHLDSCMKDRASKQSLIDSLNSQIRQCIESGDIKQKAIEELRIHLKTCTESSRARQKAIEELQAQLQTSIESGNSKQKAIKELQAQLQASIESGNNKQTAIEELKKSCAEKQSSIQHQSETLAQLHKQITTATQILEDLTGNDQETKNRTLALLNAAPTGRFNRFSFIGKQADEDNNPRNKLLKSGYFSSIYYLLHYPDIYENNIDPVSHYLEFGWKEGRNPSAQFDNSDYLKEHPELIEQGINPLLDFIEKNTGNV